MTELTRHGFVADLSEILRAGAEFRRVLATTERTQLVVMTLQAGEEIGAETHDGIDQTLVETGGGIEALAVDADDAQRRSFPNSFGRHHATAGYEHFLAMDLPGNGRRIAAQAAQLLTAKP